MQVFKAIDLFAGCGGFSCGMQRAGIEIICAVEIDKHIASSYKHNHPNTFVIVDDIKNVDNARYFRPHQADIIIGGSPCQGFSTAGARIRKNFVDDERNYLFKHYLNIVKLVKPKIFIFENVKGILSFHKGAIFTQIKQAFKDAGYELQHFISMAKDFGIPQARQRVIVIGSVVNFSLQNELEKTKQELLSKDKFFFDEVSVNDALSNLPKPTNDGKIHSPKANNAYLKFLESKKPFIFNHSQTKHNAVALKRMSLIKQSENFTSLKENIRSVHSGSYGRLDANKLAPTITTRFDTPSGGRFIHPFENRTITPREAARIQSFPDDFEFLGSKTSICKQIGNAVPPKMSYFLGLMIKRILQDECK